MTAGGDGRGKTGSLRLRVRPQRRAAWLWTMLAILAVMAGPAADADDDESGSLFGSIDLTVWYLAEYLSGTQKDEARLNFMQNLPPEQLAELGRRCDRLQPEFARHETDVRLVCESAWAVINRRD
jgi:hypothetical protein